MPWQSQGGGGGPWGGGSNGGGGGGGPWGRGPGGPGGGFGGQRPPDLEDLIKKSQDRFRRFMPGRFGGGRALMVVAAAILVIWGLTGFYRVQPEQQGVVLVFGRWTDTTLPGLHWNWPYPIGQVLTPRVTAINTIDIGYRAPPGAARNERAWRDVPAESLMLTGDQNIIDIDFSVQWKIADAGRFLFNIRDPEATVKIAAESAMRDVIGQTDIQPALTEARGEVEARTKTLLQELLIEYGAGIEVTELKLLNVQPPAAVIDAFNDVQRALQDRDRLRNEADAYRNDILPRARGEAQQMLQNAAAYREQLINEAQGEAQRFLEILDAYKDDPTLTRRRMYLETMQGVLSNTDKVIMDQPGESAVPYLPLNELRRGNRSVGTGGRQQVAPSASQQ